MQPTKFFLLLNILCYNFVYSGNDKVFQPKSLFATCFLVAAKYIKDPTEIDRCPLKFKEPLKALSQAHHNQCFSQENFKAALEICASQAIINYFEEDPTSFNNLCWIIANDARNNINDALLFLPYYSWHLVDDKIFFAAALLSLGANINTVRGGTNEQLISVKNKTPLLNAIKTRKPYLVKYFLVRGADVNMKINNRTPLEYAQHKYHSLWDLITNNMQVQIKTRIKNAEKIIEILYEHGAKDKCSAEALGWHDRFCTIQ